MLVGCGNSNPSNQVSETPEEPEISEEVEILETLPEPAYSVNEESGFYNSGYTFFVCEETGTYYFEVINPTDTLWKVYLLEEEWLEAPRFIGQTSLPSLKLSIVLAYDTLEIEEGQYIYVFCPKYIGYDDKIEEDVALEFGLTD